MWVHCAKEFTDGTFKLIASNSTESIDSFNGGVKNDMRVIVE